MYPLNQDMKTFGISLKIQIPEDFYSAEIERWIEGMVEGGGLDAEVLEIDAIEL